MKKFLLILSIICFAVVLGALPLSTAFASEERGEKPRPMPKAEKQLENYSSRSAFVIDYDTGKVLYERNADAKYPIASMVKIMTLNIVFDEIEAGNLSFDEKIVISENASGMGGSQMFLDTGLEYSVSDLIKGVTVVSANDASVALAERIAGSVEAFIDLMNDKAKNLGMNDTVFVNVTGLPQSGQHSTAKDVSKMMKNLLKHQKYYDFSTVYLENYTHPDGRITELTNTNKLIRFYKGCDGGKTGFTNDAMFCLSATAKRDDTRIIATVLGAESSKERNKEITDLFNYAFHNYKTIKIIEKDKIIPAEISVKGSKTDKIEVTADKDVCVLAKRNEKPDFDVNIVIDENLKAPIEKGAVIGKIVLTDKSTGEIKDEANLITLTEIEGRSYLDGLRKILENWFICK